MSVRLRSTLSGVPSYVPGRPAEHTAYKISSNENPYPPLPSVLEVVARAAGHMNRYPDMAATALTEAIAAHVGVDPQRVAVGTGSVGVLGQILAATCGDGDEVVHAWRSFEAYPIMVQLSGAKGVPVPLAPGGRHDLPAMAAAITERTRLVLVCTPNNPTGPAVHADELEAFLDAVPEDVLVVVDEAYVEFVRDPQVPDAVGVHRRRPNVAVLRTFSKAYGLAGLRVGYAVASPEVADALRKTAVPFGVSGIAQDAAIASLAAYDELKVRVDALVDQRGRVVAGLRAQGWDVPDSEANFVWLELGEQTTGFARMAEAAGVVVRPFAGSGARCTVAEPEAADLLLDVCAAFRQSLP
ncbi:MAG: histidinol-phosphate transaminase [Actinomycetales bacterium]